MIGEEGIVEEESLFAFRSRYSTDELGSYIRTMNEEGKIEELGNFVKNASGMVNWLF